MDAGSPSRQYLLQTYSADSLAIYSLMVLLYMQRLLSILSLKTCPHAHETGIWPDQGAVAVLLLRWTRARRSSVLEEASSRRVKFIPGGRAGGSTGNSSSNGSTDLCVTGAAALDKSVDLVENSRAARLGTSISLVRRSAQQCWRNAVVTLPTGRVRRESSRIPLLNAHDCWFALMKNPLALFRPSVW